MAESTEFPFKTQREIRVEAIGVHSLYKDYPLLPGDQIVKQEDGSWAKLAPGLGITGFALSDDFIRESTVPSSKKWVV